MTPAQIGQQLKAAYVLAGSLRRAGNRLRINAQLVDTQTDFPLWSERYDRELKDVFEVQDEIARRIAEALRIKLSPQEQAAIAAKPTENLQAYDLYLRGRSYARRRTRQDMEFALQMFENAVALDPNFALAHAAIANGCANAHYWTGGLDPSWMERARAASERAVELAPAEPEVQASQGWLLYAQGEYEPALRIARSVVARKSDTEGAYFLLLRLMFASGLYQEVAAIAEAALEASGEDYNVYVPILNALSALGKQEAVKNVRQRMIQALESHVRQVPEDARARTLLGSGYAEENRFDAVREVSLAMVLRPNEAAVLYNAACTFCFMNRKAEAMDALSKAWHAGFKDADWARRDPDLALLHGEPEFERLYPEKRSTA